MIMRETAVLRIVAISAILMDTTENGEPFKAYMLKDRLSRILPKKITGHYKMGEGCPQSDLMEYVMSTTEGKYVTGGWTDLNNPGLGYKAKEYSKSILRQTNTMIILSICSRQFTLWKKAIS